MAVRRLPTLALALTLAAGSAACGSTTGSSQPVASTSSTPKPQHRCPRAPQRLAADLRGGVGGVRLERVFAVRSDGGFNRRTPELSGGVYFVSADVGVRAAGRDLGGQRARLSKRRGTNPCRREGGTRGLTAALEHRAAGTGQTIRNHRGDRRLGPLARLRKPHPRLGSRGGRWPRGPPTLIAAWSASVGG
jgi:hypothetical protein